MKTAKEMFEELGYESTNSPKNWIGYRSGELGRSVHFSTNYRYYNLSGNNYNEVNVSVRLHLAIHQQMKELGWIE